MNKTAGRFLGLIIVTAFAGVIAVWVTIASWSGAGATEDNESNLVVPKTPVSVMEVRRESIEITDTYSGMIRPFERYTLGFEIAGRVLRLGANAEGQPLDDGDRVAANQVLAELDSRSHIAQLKEANALLASAKAQLSGARGRLSEVKAQLEQAQSNMHRADELRQRGIRAITETEYQEHVTALAVARAQSEQADAQLEQTEAQLEQAVAQAETAQKNLQDTRLVAPVGGVISKRLVNAGETVGAHQTIVEIIQVDEVLLVVGVPEAYVGHVRVDQPVYVELLARDRFRRKRSRTEGRVFRVAEAADQTTGLFEIEILLRNDGRQWRPGLIALAHIVIDRVDGFRVPVSCAVFRDEETFLFNVDGQGKARRVELRDWIEQDGELVVGGLAPDQRTIVKRGQHRLVDGCDVEFVQLDEDRLPELQRPPAIRSPTTVVGSKLSAEANN